ncbi:SDR family NAD(P)-dependent oxidoreductase [Mesorhizobium comanense]|uniref:SDR family NAD(P)-dependent oxidoreductase n=1 Tax=Mesorhizobium comanense TaxID=2502215 RepID=UPI0010F80AB9|nr:SDR family oxidoreductase [Mesorhizobium comanense]
MYAAKQRLDGRIAFITGAASGIGFCTAEALAEAGARVILSDLNEASLDAAAGALRGKGYPVSSTLLDITDSAACTEIAARMNRDVGSVDILIANAGIAWADTRAEDLDDQAWSKVIDVNLSGAFWSCRAFGRHMLERRRGSIVTVGSMSGFISNKPQSQVHYNASKAGLHHLTRSLAGEWADRGVRVNGVAPTYVNTVMSNVTARDPAYFSPWMEGTPMKRMVEPEEVASVNLFLASDAASAMTGAIILVDAGYTIW